MKFDFDKVIALLPIYNNKRMARKVYAYFKAFKDSFDEPVSGCRKCGKEPEKRFSGNLHLKISPKLHAKLAQEAARNNLSLNSFIIEKLKK